MKACQLTITTVTDGKETHFTTAAQAEITAINAKIEYMENDTQVLIEVEENTVKIFREGDYTLHLTVQEGVLTQGTLGIGGSNGALSVLGKKVNYSLQKDSLLLSMQYDLLFGDERQEMKIRLFAKEK